LLDERFHLRGLADVTGHREHIATDPGAGRLELLGGTCADRDLRPYPSQFFCCRQPASGTTSRDDGDLAAEHVADEDLL